MPNDFDLADFWKSFDFAAQQGAIQCSGGIHSRNIQRRQLKGALAAKGLLEDQPFVAADVAAGLFPRGRRSFCDGGLSVQ